MLSCLAGRYFFVFTPQVAAIALPEVMKMLPFRQKAIQIKKIFSIRLQRFTIFAALK